eukprot:UN27562
MVESLRPELRQEFFPNWENPYEAVFDSEVTKMKIQKKLLEKERILSIMKP